MARDAAYYREYRLKNLEKRRAYERAYREANREKEREKSRRYQATEKGRARMRKHDAKPERKEQHRQWAQSEKGRAYHADYNQKNAERIRENQRAYVEANREADRAKHRRYYARNQEEKKAKHRAFMKTARGRWVNRVNAANRRAREGKAGGTASYDQIMARVAFYGGLCYLCGAEWEHIDHVKPIARGGSNWPSNLRPICAPCNSRKHARSLEEVKQSTSA